MKVLLLAETEVSADAVRSALRTDGAGDDLARETEVKVVAPALHASGLRFWLSDADEAIARAREVGDATVRELNAAQFDARGTAGESDPLQAIADALVDFPADRILVAPGADDRHRSDLDDTEVQRRFGIAVERIAADH